MERLISIERYFESKNKQWDLFVDESKNGTFMLKRGYMDYHSDRFQDYSLMFYEENKLVALLPASLHDKEICSHGGLTYGGFIVGRKMSAQLMLAVMKSLIAFLKNDGKERLVYKRIPYIYYDYPSDEDLYALFRFNAQLTRRDISTAILVPDKIRFNERRRRNVKKALKEELSFELTDDYAQYMDLLADVLSTRHDTKPVHSTEEIRLLASRFPDNIKLYCTYRAGQMLAGTIIYETPKVAHAQYIASSFDGRDCGALDFCFDKLINEVYTEKTFFDFGISTENKGQILNEGLIEQKQEFGGRGVIYEEYTIEVK